MAVVIVGDPGDLHVQRVREMVARYDVDAFLLHPYANEAAMTYECGPLAGPSITFRVASNVIDASAISAVWWRAKRIVPPVGMEKREREADGFARSEWRMILRSLSDCLAPNVRWVNGVAFQDRANSKLYQLNLAAEVGLNIPRTVISNDPDSVLRLFHSGAEVIYKTLSGYVFPPDETIFTTRVAESDIEQDIAGVGRAPGIYQELIHKSYELRVTVVGERVFPVKICSQRDPETILDWRRSQLVDMYEMVVLPDDLQASLLRFGRMAGLHFAVYDLVVDCSGDVWFLECNPAGQWLWLEDRLHLPISAALAGDLAAADVELNRRTGVPLATNTSRSAPRRP